MRRIQLISFCKWVGSKGKNRHEQFKPYKPKQGEESDCGSDDVEEVVRDEEKGDKKEFVLSLSYAFLVSSQFLLLYILDTFDLNTFYLTTRLIVACMMYLIYYYNI